MTGDERMSAGGAVKSADRVLRMLELLGAADRPLRASEAARALAIPMSSIMALFGTMVQRGFASFDDESRTYRLTDRLSIVGGGRVSSPLRDAAVTCARRLNRDLGIGVAVSHLSGLYIQWDFTLGFDYLSAGATLPLFRTINALAFLSQKSKRQVEDLVERYNDKFGRGEAMHSAEVLTLLQRWRGRDHISGCPPGYPSVGAICIYLADESNSEEVLLSAVIPASQIASYESPVVARVRLDLGQYMRHAVVS